jgi:hypothetical protein
MSKVIIAIGVIFFGSTFASMYLMYKVYQEIENDDWT